MTFAIACLLCRDVPVCSVGRWPPGFIATLETRGGIAGNVSPFVMFLAERSVTPGMCVGILEEGSNSSYHPS